jgi:hypothetical protein
LDLILTRYGVSTIETTRIVDGISDHKAIVFLLSSAIFKPICSVTAISKRVFNKINADIFQSDIRVFACDPIMFQISMLFSNQQSTFISSEEGIHHVHSFLSIFDNNIRQVIDNHAPLCSLNSSRKTVPWWTNKIRYLRARTIKAERRGKRSGLEIFRILHTTLKLSLHKAIKAAKISSLAQSLRRSKGEPKRLWHLLNSAAGRVSLPHKTCYESVCGRQILALVCSYFSRHFYLNSGSYSQS